MFFIIAQLRRSEGTYFQCVDVSQDCELTEANFCQWLTGEVSQRSPYANTVIVTAPVPTKLALQICQLSRPEINATKTDGR